MQQLLPFLLNLIIIAWLRDALVVRKGLPRRHRLYVQLGFDILLVLPLLVA